MLDLLFYCLFNHLSSQKNNLMLAGLGVFLFFQPVIQLQQFFIYETSNHFFPF